MNFIHLQLKKYFETKHLMYFKSKILQINLYNY